MACVELSHLQKLLTALPTSTDTQSLSDLAALVASDICGVLIEMANTSEIQETPLPYEIDGYGSQYFMVSKIRCKSIEALHN